MKARPVVPRGQAARDVDEAIASYLSEGAVEAARCFIDALEQAYAHICRQTATGSSHYAHELNLPDMRAWSLTHNPHMMFYVERADHIDVWRVLHGKPDVPAWMRESGPDP